MVTWPCFIDNVIDIHDNLGRIRQRNKLMEHFGVRRIQPHPLQRNVPEERKICSGGGFEINQSVVVSECKVIAPIYH